MDVRRRVVLAHDFGLAPRLDRRTARAAQHLERAPNDDLRGAFWHGGIGGIR